MPTSKNNFSKVRIYIYGLHEYIKFIYFRNVDQVIGTAANHLDHKLIWGINKKAKFLSKNFSKYCLLY